MLMFIHYLLLVATFRIVESQTMKHALGIGQTQQSERNVGDRIFDAYQASFRQWIKDFKNNVYDPHLSVRQKRLEIFAANLDKIDRLNEKHAPATFGLNEYADLTWDEFKVRLHSYAPERSIQVKREADQETSIASVGLPNKFTWRNFDKQIVTPVKNQAFKVGPSFQFYQSGTLSALDCETNENLWHSVAVTGFGKTHWEIKNSFGTTWGEGEFGKVKRNSNWCQIEDGPITGMFHE